MQICLQQARAGSLPIGAAVVVRDHHIIGRGRYRIFEHLAERPEARCLSGHRLAHAEMNALVSVDHAVNVRDCVPCMTPSPCALVRRRYSHAGVPSSYLNGLANRPPVEAWSRPIKPVHAVINVGSRR